MIVVPRGKNADKISDGSGGSQTAWLYHTCQAAVGQPGGRSRGPWALPYVFVIICLMRNTAYNRW